jgi:ubiquitin-protein ligase
VEKRAEAVWHVHFVGPEQSVFEGMPFTVEVGLDQFPYKAPTVTFMSQIYHPNVGSDRRVCEDMIGVGSKWKAAKKLSEVLDQLKSLMLLPVASNIANEQAWKDYQEFKWKAKVHALAQN